MRDETGRRALRSFGNRVRRARVSRELSQEQLAERAELDRTYISGIERGIRNVSLLNIYKIADALQLSARDLLK
jgi:transcriptional regulator with XRE-family HTH domain